MTDPAFTAADATSAPPLLAREPRCRCGHAHLSLDGQWTDMCMEYPCDCNGYDAPERPSADTRDVSVEAVVQITLNDREVIERITGPGGDEWRAALYQLHTEEDVLRHLAYNCVANGTTQVNALDGWADLPDDAATMTIAGWESLAGGGQSGSADESAGAVLDLLDAVNDAVHRGYCEAAGLGEWDGNIVGFADRERVEADPS